MIRDKQTVFMLTIYIILIIIMYAFVGISIQSGDEPDKRLCWAFFGFSITFALICIITLNKFTGNAKHKVRMGISALLLTGLLLGGLILSKPSVDTNFKAITYATCVMVFFLNMMATFYLIHSTMNVIPFNLSKPSKQSKPIVSPVYSPVASAPPYTQQDYDKLLNTQQQYDMRLLNTQQQ